MPYPIGLQRVRHINFLADLRFYALDEKPFATHFWGVFFGSKTLKWLGDKEINFLFFLVFGDLGCHLRHSFGEKNL